VKALRVYAEPLSIGTLPVVNHWSRALNHVKSDTIPSYSEYHGVVPDPPVAILAALPPHIYDNKRVTSKLT